jgi:hypothetical protein
MPAASWARQRSRGSGSCGASFPATPDRRRPARSSRSSDMLPPQARRRNPTIGASRRAADPARPPRYRFRHRAAVQTDPRPVSRLPRSGSAAAVGGAVSTPIDLRRSVATCSGGFGERSRSAPTTGRNRRLCQDADGPPAEAPPNVAGDVAGIPRRPSTGKQGSALPGRPAEGRKRGSRRSSGEACVVPFRRMLGGRAPGSRRSWASRRRGA